MKKDSLHTQLISKLSPETLATFTPAQLKALKSACQQLHWKDHAIDIRLSIPFPGNGYYAVFLAGKEKRSRQRLRVERSKRSKQSPVPLVMFVSTVSVLGCSVALGSLKATEILLHGLETLNHSTPHATAIPWLTNESECTHTGRSWQDDQCWDAKHSPDF